MKNSTNLTFLIKVLVLSFLLIVGYSKDYILKTTENNDEIIESFDGEEVSVAQIQL